MKYENAPDLSQKLDTQKTADGRSVYLEITEKKVRGSSKARDDEVCIERGTGWYR